MNYHLKMENPQSKPANPETAIKIIFELWNLYLSRLYRNRDPLIASIFPQAQNIRLQVKLSFPKNLKFFHEWVDKTRDLWGPELKEVFGDIDVVFDYYAPDFTPTIQAKSDPVNEIPL